MWYKSSEEVKMSNYLDKKWEKGELKAGFYYTKILAGDGDNEKIVDSINYFYEAGYFDSDDVQEVLAKVPSYQELMSLKRKAKFLK